MENLTNLLENVDWLNVIPVGLAVAIFIGGWLMMFTDLFTRKNK